MYIIKRLFIGRVRNFQYYVFIIVLFLLIGKIIEKLGEKFIYYELLGDQEGLFVFLDLLIIFIFCDNVWVFCYKGVCDFIVQSCFV